MVHDIQFTKYDIPYILVLSLLAPHTDKPDKPDTPTTDLDSSLARLNKYRYLPLSVWSKSSYPTASHRINDNLSAKNPIALHMHTRSHTIAVNHKQKKSQRKNKRPSYK